MTDEELAEFRAWKRAKNKDELEEAFHVLERSMDGPRGFNCIMPSLAYRTLATALMVLKRRLIDDI